jgi:hypothetical protein
VLLNKSLEKKKKEQFRVITGLEGTENTGRGWAGVLE